jgi:hypothetical protein
MQAPIETDEIWQSTVTRLSSKGEMRLPTGSSDTHPMYGQGYVSTCAIQVLERKGQTSATVAWSDSTSCCYGEQIWRRCIAKKGGVCVLSGQLIAKGDAVYRPRCLKPAPRNFEAMILATVIQDIPLEEVL